MIKAETDTIREYRNHARRTVQLDEKVVHACTLADPALAPEMGDLIDLVLSGQKKGTAHLAIDFEKSAVARRDVGDLWIILGADLEPRCLVRITAVEAKSFDQVSAAFAATEGEGDLSLAHWRDVHRDYYKRQCAAWGIAWREDLAVVCENFEFVDEA